jgi:hypothetical protein
VEYNYLSAAHINRSSPTFASCGRAIPLLRVLSVLFDRLLDRDPYFEERAVEGLRAFVHEVCYADFLHVAQPVISALLHALLSSSVHRFSLFLASVLHDLVGQTKQTRMQCVYTH